MIELLQSFNLSVEHWMLAVPVFAGIFGGRYSVGLVLPMLCFADIFGVSYYHRHAEWFHIRRLLPWTLAGIVLGLLVGGYVSDELFREFLAAAVLFSVAVLIWREISGTGVTVPDYWWISALMGLGGGFFTMIGNAAGPVLTLYLLSMGLPKYTFIGTRAWFFLIVNFLKVPLHIFFWKNYLIAA